MQNGKFFTLLYTLEEKEVQVFHKYLKQLHGKDQIPLRAFEYAREVYMGGQPGEKSDVAQAYHRIYRSALSDQEGPRKKMLKNMLNLFHDLHLRLKDFLLLEKLRRDPLASQALWLEILQERKLHDECAKQTARFYTEARAAPQIDAKKYLTEMAASYFHYHQLTLVRPIPDIAALQQCLETLEVCAETLRIRLACQLANVRKVHPPKADAAPPALPFRLPEARIIDSAPLLALYCDIYRLVETEEEEYYNRIEAVFKENQLDIDELHGALGFLHNYAAAQRRNGAETEINKRVHQLNQIGFEHGLFHQPGKMTATQFTNTIALACSVKDSNWAVLFLEDCQVMLAENIRSDTVVLARANIAYSKKEFQQVVSLLDRVDFKSIYQVIHSRSLILRSYVELDKEDALEYCTSFEAFLSRHRNPKTQAVEATMASVRIVKVLLLGKEDQQTVLERIEKAPGLYFKDWLQKQAAGYEARYPKRRRTP